MPVPQYVNGAYILAGDDGFNKTMDERINAGVNLYKLYNGNISGQPYSYYLNNPQNKNIPSGKKLEPSFITLPFNQSVTGIDKNVIDNYLLQTFMGGHNVEMMQYLPNK